MNRHRNLGGSVRTSSLAFTLIELLTVVAIIALLIGILVPSLARARDSAKKVRSQATLDAIGKGLELFRTENEDELKGNNYPSSAAGDDPTDGANATAFGSEDMFGGQWLVRYMMGKDRNGYIAQRNVPKTLWGTDTFNQQVGWYDNPDIPRCPPYVNDAPVKAPKDLPGQPESGPVSPTDTTPKYNNPVFIDSFGMPVLYYAANSRYAERTDANPTAYVGPPTQYQGIYTYLDNAIFTGMCTDGTCLGPFPRWDFGGGKHKMEYGPSSWVAANPPNWKLDVPGHANSFAYRILSDKSTRKVGSQEQLNSAAPMRRDGFILLTPGKDGLFGTNDDIANFGG